MKEVKEILAKYEPGDYDLFKATVDMLCKKGIGNGCYQDYTVLVDVVKILSICERIVQEGGVE